MTDRIGRISVLAAVTCLAAASVASAQTSSLFLRGQQGQFGSNQPNVMLIVEPAAAATSPGAAGPMPANATSAAPVLAARPSTAVGAESDAAPGWPTGPVRSFPPAGVAYSVPSGGGRDASVSPAVATLQRASFMAITPPRPKQFRLRDLVTIIVREETTFASDGETDLEKKSSVDAKLEQFLKLSWSNPPLKVIDLDQMPKLKGSASRKFEGDGTVKRKDSFVGRLTAEVVDIKPNGTLVLSARKFIKTDEEEQMFELTGICRAQDVNPDNTVLSTQLADLTVSKTHRGAVYDSTKRGILPWLTDKVNPW